MGEDLPVSPYRRRYARDILSRLWSVGASVELLACSRKMLWWGRSCLGDNPAAFTNRMKCARTGVEALLRIPKPEGPPLVVLFNAQSGQLPENRHG
jgi:hypothetical protein